jgi:sulfide:quinone oxidoreductase
LAIGARRETSADWTLTFTGPEDVASFQRLLARISRGARQGVVTRLAFVVPPGAGWPLPAYELALATARRLDRRGVRDAVRLTLVTAEERPLEVFGARASAAIADDLRSAGITVISGVVETRWSWGRLHLRPAGSVAVERVVGLPRLRGPWIAGVPADADGFMKTHSDGRVVGLRDVYAIGDATTYPVKQGGVGCQQADLVAGAIAAEAGGRDLPPPVEPALRAQLWDDERGRGLAIDLADGRPVGEGKTWRTAALWPWHHKVSCRFLSPFLEDLVGHAPSSALPQPMEKLDERRRWTDT